jgi:hypothetical protein
LAPTSPNPQKIEKKARKSPKKPDESSGFIIQMKRSFRCKSTKHRKLTARQLESTYMVNRDPRHRYTTTKEKDGQNNTEPSGHRTKASEKKTTG